MITALIDTCVVIDLLQKREPFFDDAYKIFTLVANQNIEGCLSAKSILDIYYLMKHVIHNDKETRNVITNLNNLFSIIDTSANDCKMALLSSIKDYEDAVMVETAIANKVDCIVTRNIKDYNSTRMLIFTPEDFLKKINN